MNRIPPAKEADARALFTATVSADPFQKIPAALLNSSDIYNYACATGMVFPFDPDNLKSASLAVRVGNKVIYWDEANRPISKVLSTGENFSVTKNTIVFVQTREKFHLPNYIAMRFDLKISNAHRGLLRGSGPLIDPGFEGHLLVPLHNLTTNDYSFQEGETFCWVEFTKVSPHQSWDSTIPKAYEAYRLDDKFKAFPTRKKNMSAWDYLNDASKGPIRSSMAEVRHEVEKAVTSARRWNIGTMIAAIAIFMTAGIAGSTLLNTLWTQIGDSQKDARETKARTEDQALRLEHEISTLEARMHDFQDEMRRVDVDRRLTHLEDELSQLKPRKR